MRLRSTTLESLRVAVLGQGKAGRALALEFAAAGVPIVGVWNRSERPAGPVAAPQACGDGSDPGARVAEWGARVVVVAVKDDAVPGFVADLRVPEGVVVLHTSGSLPLSEIAAPRGAHLGGWHPLQALGSRPEGATPVPLYWVALDGDAAAVAAGRALAEATGHPSVVVRGAAKAAYHAAAVLSSNALVALESLACAVMEEAGVAPEDCWPLLRPLVVGTLDNLSRGSFGEVITGPVARGDATTVLRNLAATDKVAGASEVYRALGREALRLVDSRLDADDSARVRDALRGPERQE